MATVRIPMSEPAPNVPAPRGLLARLRRARAAADAAWLEGARQRMRSQPSLFALLTPELLEELRHSEPAAVGGPAPLRPDR